MIRSATLLLIAASLAGCSLAGQADATDKRFALRDTVLAESAPADRAVLCVVREQFVRKNPLPPERLYLDGAPLGFLPQRSWLSVEVEPGLRRLSGVIGAPELVLDCRPGRLYLLRMREIVDERDVLSVSWVLDDPDLAGSLTGGAGLPRSVATTRGIKDLSGRPPRIPDRVDTLLAGPGGPPLVLDNVWCEHPLDMMNLRRDFSVYTGRLELDDRVLRYRLEKRRRDMEIEIPIERIVSLRYGGTRYTGTNPWLDVFYQSGESTEAATFAGADAETAGRIYNVLYMALDSRWRAMRGVSMPVPEELFPVDPIVRPDSTLDR
jgi:hypothetical protein